VWFRTSAGFRRSLSKLLFAANACALFFGAELPDAQPRFSAAPWLKERADLWKHRLKLTDWSVSVRLTPESELRPGTLGKIRWDSETKSAVISVLDTSAGKPVDIGVLRGMEDTLVHELIHLDLASLPRDDSSRTAEEYAVNRVAEALLELDRKDATSPQILTTAAPADLTRTTHQAAQPYAERIGHP
jgi:hypothetical protein